MANFVQDRLFHGEISNIRQQIYSFLQEVRDHLVLESLFYDSLLRDFHESLLREYYDGRYYLHNYWVEDYNLRLQEYFRLQEHGDFLAGELEFYDSLLFREHFGGSYSHYRNNIDPRRIPSRRGEDYNHNNTLIMDEESYFAAGMRHDVPSMDVMIRKNLKTKSFRDVEAKDEDGVTKICAVCQDDLCCDKRSMEIGVLDCRHEYHAGCIKNWLLIKNICPLCNATGVKLD